MDSVAIAMCNFQKNKTRNPINDSTQYMQKAL